MCVRVSVLAKNLTEHWEAHQALGARQRAEMLVILKGGGLSGQIKNYIFATLGSNLDSESKLCSENI